MLKQIISLLILGSVGLLSAQNNINNPYSIYGVGVENVATTGGLTGLGNSGVAQKTYGEINLFNPSNLANIPKRSFLQDFGFNTSFSTIKNNDTSQSTNKANISHIAFAFPITKGWGMSLGLLPYTTVGYEINTESTEDGSPETFIVNTLGSGGLNRFYLSSGIKVIKNLSLGIEFTALFGNVNKERQLLSDGFVSITEQNHYSGVKLKTGFQYTVFSNDKNETTLGATFELPSSLGGTKTTSSYKIISGATIDIENAEDSDIDNFELPTSYGFGVSSAFRKFTTNLDYKKVLWDETSQVFNDASYTNQSIYAFGLEYIQYNNKADFFRNVKYRFGLNYNTGFLKVTDEQIDNYFVSAGIGIPIHKEGRNRLNISYSYGKEGTTNNRLIQENYHKLSFNLSFNGSWFRKRKIQ